MRANNHQTKTIHARLALAVAVAVLCCAAFARAEPKPKRVDIKPFRDQLVVLADARGYVYVIKPRVKVNRKYLAQRVFYGLPGKTLYEQVNTGYSRNDKAYSYQTWAPRLRGIQPAYLMFDKQGTFHRKCADDDVVLTQLTGDKAKAVLDKSELRTPFLTRRPHLLARDDSGVYYYVDRLAPEYGGRGYRVFVGRKGALRQRPLVDVATDTAGQVFSTRSGDLRLASTSHDAVWIRGNKRTQLVYLDTITNSRVIFNDLGIYHFLGTVCDTILTPGH